MALGRRDGHRKNITWQRSTDKHSRGAWSLSHLKGCRELKISWDWETGSPPLSPSCAWACRDVWRESGICWAVAACKGEPGDDCIEPNTPPHLHLLLACQQGCVPTHLIWLPTGKDQHQDKAWWSPNTGTVHGRNEPSQAYTSMGRIRASGVSHL